MIIKLDIEKRKELIEIAEQSLIDIFWSRVWIMKHNIKEFQGKKQFREKFGFKRKKIGWKDARLRLCDPWYYTYRSRYCSDGVKFLKRLIMICKDDRVVEINMTDQEYVGLTYNYKFKNSSYYKHRVLNDD